MQIMYVMAFLVTLMVMSMTVGKDRANVEQEDARIVAAHMAAWHRYAIEACIPGCVGGVVDPLPKLPPQIASGASFTPGRFVSRYDNVNRIVVTYVPAAFAAKGSVTMGGLAAGMQDLWRYEGETTSMGIWRAATSTINYALSPAGSPIALPLSVPFMGGFIPDGSPVIVSNAF